MRNLSTSTATAENPQGKSKRQRLLVHLKRIRQDLFEVDSDHDRHMDFEELKLLQESIPKHLLLHESTAWENYCTWDLGRAGKPVRLSTFLREVRHFLCHLEDATMDHPLQLESIALKGCWATLEKKGDQHFYNAQQKFVDNLQSYFGEISAKEQHQEKKLLMKYDQNLGVSIWPKPKADDEPRGAQQAAKQKAQIR